MNKKMYFSPEVKTRVLYLSNNLCDVISGSGTFTDTGSSEEEDESVFPGIN